MNNKDLITSDQILGKEVVNSEGDIIGIVERLHIHKTQKQIIGLTIDEGFMKPNLFIGIENIKLFGVDTIFLNTTPSIKFKGLKVFNKQGELVGTVQEVVSTPRSSKIKEIIIKHKFKTETIAAKAIKSIGVNVILK